VWIMKSSMAAPMEAPTAAIFRYQPANLMIWFAPSESSRAGWPERAQAMAVAALRSPAMRVLFQPSRLPRMDRPLSLSHSNKMGARPTEAQKAGPHRIPSTITLASPLPHTTVTTRSPAHGGDLADDRIHTSSMPRAQSRLLALLPPPPPSRYSLVETPAMQP
jgi:hypothetical protein